MRANLLGHSPTKKNINSWKFHNLFADAKHKYSGMPKPWIERQWSHYRSSPTKRSRFRSRKDKNKDVMIWPRKQIIVHLGVRCFARWACTDRSTIAHISVRFGKIRGPSHWTNWMTPLGRLGRPFILCSVTKVQLCVLKREYPTILIHTMVKRWVHDECTQIVRRISHRGARLSVWVTKSSCLCSSLRGCEILTSLRG